MLSQRRHGKLIGVLILVVLLVSPTTFGPIVSASAHARNPIYPRSTVVTEALHQPIQRTAFPVIPTWSQPTSLPAGRSRPAVAVGHDGNLYVFGGTYNGTDYNTTFIYHPRNNTWTIGAPLPVALEGAIAIVLTDGRIVILGGGSGCGSDHACNVYSTAYVYTPTHNTWSLLPSMQSPRYRFAAALGSDGRIYAIGGWYGNTALSSVEAFSFKTNSWTYVFSLPQPERAAAAAVDAKGNLYVMGGDNGAADGAIYYNNVYRYTSNGWMAVAAMPTAREDLTATRGPDGQIFAIAGYNSSGPLSTVEAYNPTTGVWSTLTPLPSTTCCVVAVTLPGGKIAVVGGGDPPTFFAIYGPVPTFPSNPPIPSWSQPTSLLATRVRPAVAVTKDGTLYMFGGEDANTEYNNTLIYHPKTNSWAFGAPMPVALEGGVAVALANGQIVVLGGAAGCRGTYTCTIYSTVSLYSPRTNSWSLLPSMQSPRYRFTALLGHDGRLYAIGGWDGHTGLSSVEAFDFHSHTWSYAYGLPQPTIAPAAALDAHGRLLVFGGFQFASDGSSIYDNNVLIAGANGWNLGAPLPTAREDMGAVRGPDGLIYVIGGYNGSVLSTVDAYNPAANAWIAVAPLPQATCCLGVAASSDRIYAVGGGTMFAVYGPFKTVTTPAPTKKHKK